MPSSAEVRQPPLISDGMGDSGTFVIDCLHMTVAGQERLIRVTVFLEAACKAAELGETGPDHGLESQVGVLPHLHPWPLASCPVLSLWADRLLCVLWQSSCLGLMAALHGREIESHCKDCRESA